jgi:hypothetical protein
MTAGGDSAGLVSTLTAWVSTNAVWIVAISTGYFFLSILVIRLLVVRMPADYFAAGRRAPSEYAHPAAAIALRIGKNILGALVILVGLVMSLPGVPGQGFLTLLIGLTLTDFPGKRKIELWILRQHLILKAINGLRTNAGKPPLIIPGEDHAGPGEGGERGQADG